MKKVLIAGNWKSNKTVSEGLTWVEEFKNNFWEKRAYGCEIVLFVPFTHLYPLKERILELNLPLELGAQDISPFPEGAFTGEESGRMIGEVANWVLVGHSERRSYLNENDEELVFEVQQAKRAGLKVIYCVTDKNMNVPFGVDVVGYEPVGAIGSGKAEDPYTVGAICKKIKETSKVEKVLYGGSVQTKNVRNYLDVEFIDGVLVGGLSLEATKFVELIYAANK